MMDALSMLRDMLAGAQEDLIRYKWYKGSGDPCLEANYIHKQEQVERLKRQIKEAEDESKATHNI